MIPLPTDADASVDDYTSIMRSALSLYLAHHHQRTAPMLAGDESDIEAINRRERLARELLAGTLQLDDELYWEYRPEDHSTPTADEVLDDAVRHSQEWKCVLPANHVGIQTDALLSVYKLLEHKHELAATEACPDSINGMELTRVHSHVADALGYYDRADHLSEEYQLQRETNHERDAEATQ